MDIPYSVRARPDTGVTNSTLGMWLFLASEVMLFGSLLSAYAILRTGAESWPDQSSLVSVPLALTNTLVLLASSFTIRRAWTGLKGGAIALYRIYMGATIVLGMLFLSVKAFEYADKLGHGLVPATNNFLALYFVLTGLHALHVLGGLGVNAYLIGPGSRVWDTEPERLTGRVATAGLYWHFVDAVWIVLVVVVYLL